MRLSFPARGAYSVCQRWAAKHSSQIRPVTGPLEGQAERGKEHLKRHILLWGPEKPSFTQPALVWITLSLSLSPSYFLFFPFLPPFLIQLFLFTKKIGIIPISTPFFCFGVQGECEVMVRDLNLLWFISFCDSSSFVKVCVRWFFCSVETRLTYYKRC